MKEVIINGKASGIYHIDLGDIGDKACWDRILKHSMQTAGTDVYLGATLVGNLIVYDLRSGRGIGSVGCSESRHILFEPRVDSAVWAALCEAPET